MTTRDKSVRAIFAVVVAAALLMPAWYGLAPDAVRGSATDCEEGAGSRCPGLWSNACCDFAVPSDRYGDELRPDHVGTVGISLAPPAALARPGDGPYARSRSAGRDDRAPHLSPHVDTTILRL